MSNPSNSTHMNTPSEITSLCNEITLMKIEKKTESEAEIVHLPQEELPSTRKSCETTSETPIEPNTIVWSRHNDLQTIVQYSESDSSEEFDIDIMKFKGDKRKYKFRGGKKKFKYFGNKRIDKYLDGSDYICVNKKNDKCNDYMYIELPTVYSYQLLSKEAIRKAAKREAEIMILMKKIGVNCPKLVYRNNHILATTFIGDNGTPAMKLTEITMEPFQWQHIYTEVIEALYKMYNRGIVIHGNLHPRNILWWQNRCWFVDFSNAYTSENLNEGFRILFRDCKFLSEFFKEKGADPESGEYLFTHITGEENWWANTFKPHTQPVIRPLE